MWMELYGSVGDDWAGIVGDCRTGYNSVRARVVGKLLTRSCHQLHFEVLENSVDWRVMMKALLRQGPDEASKNLHLGDIW